MIANLYSLEHLSVEPVEVTNFVAFFVLGGVNA